MEQLFAVRVLVHYHDKASVDHAAVRRLVMAAGVDSLRLLLSNGSSASLDSYLARPSKHRPIVTDVLDSGGTALAQVAAVFMLAEARAAADSVSSSPGELAATCKALERLLGCLAKIRPPLPLQSIHESARVKFGSAARLRALQRHTGATAADVSDGAAGVSILKAVNARLRLCDIATHCLAVVSRQCVSSRESCEEAVALSTRLLTLAASLYDEERVTANPSLSFSSSTSLRTALVAGAMHLGVIAIEHLEIDPMAWIHVANKLTTCSTSIAPRTLVLSAVFGGMITTGRKYDSVQKDSIAAARAVALLSTLHVILEQSTSTRESAETHSAGTSGTQSGHGPGPAVSGAETMARSTQSGQISHAARSFLGERVVAAEEDGDEGHIAARTVYQACEEYAARAGEPDGMVGLLSRLFKAAACQCQSEYLEETATSRQNVLNEDTDTLSDGFSARSEGQLFTMDVFEQRSVERVSHPISSNASREPEHERSDRMDLHREVGALALDTLAHWVTHGGQAIDGRAEMLQLAESFCRSAALYSLSDSPASFDLRAAMHDFGMVCGQRLRAAAELQHSLAGCDDSESGWGDITARLMRTSSSPHPMLQAMLSYADDKTVAIGVMQSYLSHIGADNSSEGGDTGSTDTTLMFLVPLVSQGNALSILQYLVKALRDCPVSYTSLASVAAIPCTSVVHLTTFLVQTVLHGKSEAEEVFRRSIVSLASADCCEVLNAPSEVPLEESQVWPGVSASSSLCSVEDLASLAALLPEIATFVAAMGDALSREIWKLGLIYSDPKSSKGSGCSPAEGNSLTQNHMPLSLNLYLRACLHLHRAICSAARFAGVSCDGFIPLFDVGTAPPGAFECMRLTCSTGLKSVADIQAFFERAVSTLSSGGTIPISLAFQWECLARECDACDISSGNFIPLSTATDLVSALASRMPVDMIRGTMLDIESGDLASLQAAFSLNSHGHYEDAIVGSSPSNAEQELCAGSSQSAAFFHCIQTAMTVMRRLGAGDNAQVLRSVVDALSTILDALVERDSEALLRYMCMAARNAFSMQDSLQSLGLSMYRCVHMCASLALGNIDDSAVETARVSGIVLRVCGMESVVTAASRSTSQMHLLCRFARESCQDAQFDQESLARAFGLEEHLAKGGSSTALPDVISQSLQKVSLEAVIAELLVPRDESAVAVSQHAISLQNLATACSKSSVWHAAVFSSLQALFCQPDKSFLRSMVERSVVMSATMNDALLAIVREAVGKCSPLVAVPMLANVFESARGLFEESVSGLAQETTWRLLNFCVIVATTYGRVCAQPFSEANAKPETLLIQLVNMIVKALHCTWRKPDSEEQQSRDRDLVILMVAALDVIRSKAWGKVVDPVTTDTARAPQTKDVKPVASTVEVDQGDTSSAKTAEQAESQDAEIRVLTPDADHGDVTSGQTVETSSAGMELRRDDTAQTQQLQNTELDVSIADTDNRYESPTQSVRLPDADVETAGDDTVDVAQVQDAELNVPIPDADNRDRSTETSDAEVQSRGDDATRRAQAQGAELTESAHDGDNRDSTSEQVAGRSETEVPSRGDDNVQALQVQDSVHGEPTPDANERDPSAEISNAEGHVRGDDGNRTPSEAGSVEEGAISSNGKLCTFTSTGNQFVAQHWYFCYTCDLAGSEGVCTVCAQVCHRGHELSYSRHSRFFCDCGAAVAEETSSHSGGANETGEEADRQNTDEGDLIEPVQRRSPGTRRPCQCLQLVAPGSSAPEEEESPAAECTEVIGADTLRESSKVQELRTSKEYQLMDTLGEELDILLREEHSSAIRQGEEFVSPTQSALRKKLSSVEVANALVSAARGLLENGDEPGGVCEFGSLDHPLTWVCPSDAEQTMSSLIQDQESGSTCTTAKLSHITRAVKSGVLGVPKPATRIAPGPSVRGSTLSHGVSGQVLATGQATGVIELINIANVLRCTSPQDKSALKVLSQAKVPFEVRSVIFHPESENALLVAGDSCVCVLLRENSTAAATWTRGDIEIGLAQFDEPSDDDGDGRNQLIKAEWVPGNDCLVMITTTKFIKVFDASADVFSPKHFALASLSASQSDRHKGGNQKEEETKPSPMRIQDAVPHLLYDDMVTGVSSHQKAFALLAITTDGKLTTSSPCVTSNDSLEFSHVCELDKVFASGSEKGKAAKFSSIISHREPSVVWISCTDGSMLCLSLLMRDRSGKSELSVRWIRHFANVLHPNPTSSMIAIPGVYATVLVFEKGHGLNAAGVLRLTTNKLMLVQRFTGNLSSAVVGAASFPPSLMSTQPSCSGGVFALSDGSLHRVSLAGGVGPAHSHLSSERAAVSALIEDVRRDQQQLEKTDDDEGSGYNPVPHTVGFFEKCRLVTDHITLGGDITSMNDGMSAESARAALAEVGLDSIVSMDSKQPFCITASTSNDALVLVGARLHFGATERSRNRVPGQVKVFGRTVKWISRNGSKRWLDIPFSLPESARSPREVQFKLEPRLIPDGSSDDGDETVALDALEVYGVSQVEFDERKQLFESEATAYHERTKKAQEVHRAQSSVLSGAQQDRINASQIPVGRFFDLFNSIYAALLSSVSTSNLATPAVSEELSGKLLIGVCAQYLRTIGRPSATDRRFLDSMLLMCEALFKSSVLRGNEEAGAGNEMQLTLLARYARYVREFVLSIVHDARACGKRPSALAVERSLHSLASMARVWLVSGCTAMTDPKDKWVKLHSDLLSPDAIAAELVFLHSTLQRSGHSLYTSLASVTANAVDVLVAQATRDELIRGDQELPAGRELEAHSPSLDPTASSLLAALLCNNHELVRFLANKRVVTVLDEDIAADDFLGSNGSDRGATPIVTIAPETSVASSSHSTLASKDENTNGEQRWAYRCDHCKKDCDREWWHCRDCKDFDLCTDCLRLPGADFSHPHHRDHLLIRSDPGEDPDEQQTDGEEEPVKNAIQTALEKVFGQLVAGLMALNRSHPEVLRGVRFLDSAQAILSLVHAPIPKSLRSSRLEQLFEPKSGFVQGVEKGLQVVVDSFHYLAPSGSLRAFCSDGLGAAEFIYLLLRIIVSVNDSVMATHLHASGIPVILSRFLESIQPGLRLFLQTRVQNEGRDISEEKPAYEIAMAGLTSCASAIPGLPFRLLPKTEDGRLREEVTNVFVCDSGLCVPESAFWCILQSVLEILDFSFRSASSASISELMVAVPQEAVCDLANLFDPSSVGLKKCAAIQRVSHTAKGLLSVVCGDNSELLHGILDRHLYESAMSRLKDGVSKIGDGMTTSTYEETIVVASALASLHRAASRRPTTWRDFAVKQESVVDCVYHAARVSSGLAEPQALQLLASAVSVSSAYAKLAMQGTSLWEPTLRRRSEPKRPTDDANATTGVGNGESIWGAELVKDIVSSCATSPQLGSHAFANDDLQKLRYLVHGIILQCQNVKSRVAGGHILMFTAGRAAADLEDVSFAMALHSFLLRAVESMPFAGKLADEFTKVMQFYVAMCHTNQFRNHSSSWMTALSSGLLRLLRSSSRLLVSHPNAHVYRALSGIVDLEGYYLEAEPCPTCSASICEAVGAKEHRLESLRAEAKFTDCAIMYRLDAVQSVSSVSVKVSDPRGNRRAKKIEVFYSTRAVSDAAALKAVGHPWRRFAIIELGSSDNEASVDLVAPVATADIMFHFVEFFDTRSKGQDDDASSSTRRTRTIRSTGSGTQSPESGVRNRDGLQCPRCSRSVTDRHGICRNCHENAYQCRQCRNINYENLDAFLCNECGYCKHGRFEFSVTAKTSHVTERVSCEEDRKRAAAIIERETLEVHRCHEQLKKIRSTIIRAMVSGSNPEAEADSPHGILGARFGLAHLLDSVAPRGDLAALEALLGGNLALNADDAASVSHAEGTSTNGSAAGDPSERVERERPASAVLSHPLSLLSRQPGAAGGNGGTKVFVSQRANILAALYGKECKAVFTSMSQGIRVLTATREELVRYADQVSQQRLRGSRGAHGGEPKVHRIADESATRLHEMSCYGCTQAFVSLCIVLLESVLCGKGEAAETIRNSGLAVEVMRSSSLVETDAVQQHTRRLVSSLVTENVQATSAVCAELARKIEFCIDSFESTDARSVARMEMAILEDTGLLEDSCWEERLRLVIRVLFRASNVALLCSSVAESIILPCLRVALHLLRSDVADGQTRGLAESTAGSRAESRVSGEGGGARAVLSLRGVGHALDIRNDVADDLSSADGQGRGDDVREESGTASVLEENDENDGNSSTAALEGSRELASVEERRSALRLGSDFMSGSGAPSSIGTAFDGHLSDDETDISRRETADIDMRQVARLMEHDHESRIIRADIGQWLQGRQSQAAWVTDLRERSRDRGSERPGEELQRDAIEWIRRWKAICNHAPSVEAVVDPTRGLDVPTPPFSISDNSWAVRLILLTPCSSVRAEACKLIEVLCGNEEVLRLRLLDTLTGTALAQAADTGENSLEFFDLLDRLLSSKRHRLYLIARGFLPRLALQIRKGAEYLIDAEKEIVGSLNRVNFSHGFVLSRLVAVLRNVLAAVPNTRSAVKESILHKDGGALVRALQRSYLCLRKLISLRTRLTDECGNLLCEVLSSKDYLFLAPTGSAVVTACVDELKHAHESNDAQIVSILLEQLCEMLCPERPEPVCHLSLNKAHTQDEYIRGSMSRNPYPSSAFDGPLMRDVKNKICVDLDLPGLLEDNSAMELLVDRQIVKLDLPIMAVYKYVWLASAAANTSSNALPLPRGLGLRHTAAAATGAGDVARLVTGRRGGLSRDATETGAGLELGGADSPMVVVYRLSGLDGEATEPIVDTLPNDSEDSPDPEELYSGTVVLGEVHGLEVLLSLLSVVGSWGDDAGTAVRAPALRLLRASCEASANRARLARTRDALGTLLDCAASAFEHAHDSPAAVESAESLIMAAEQILAEQSKDHELGDDNLSGDSVAVFQNSVEEVTSRLRVFLGRLSGLSSSKAEASILHLLPLLTQGIPDAVRLAVEHLSFDWTQIDESERHQRIARQLATVLLATPRDYRGDALVLQVLNQGTAETAVTYLADKFSLPRSQFRAQWDTSLEEAGPPLVLLLMMGLAQGLISATGRASIQEQLRAAFSGHSSAVTALCHLEMAVSENAIGSKAEELLEALALDEQIGQDIDRERGVIKSARRAAAAASRAAILRDAGLPSALTAKNAVPSASSASAEIAAGSLNMFEDVEDEVGPACVVCGDGFRCRPEEALGVYALSRRVPFELSLGDRSTSSSSTSGTSAPGITARQSSRRDWDGLDLSRARVVPPGSTSAGSTIYSSVTQFNAIHLSCHREAVRADRDARRDEWDGATLRNSQTRCNNVFPIRPPCTISAADKGTVEDPTVTAASSSYASCVEKYFGRLSSLGRSSMSQTKLTFYEIGRGLWRFADGSAGVFSEHARGGGPHSNACLIPHAVQLVMYLLEQSAPRPVSQALPFENNNAVKIQLASLESFASGQESSKDLTLYLAMSLVFHSLQQWTSIVPSFLRYSLQTQHVDEGSVLRLIAFSDLVNRALKGGMKCEDNRPWLNSLRSHIGTEETFSEQFGDLVSAGWENWIRGVSNQADFLAAIEKNAQIEVSKAETSSRDAAVVESLRACFT